MILKLDKRKYNRRYHHWNMPEGETPEEVYSVIDRMVLSKRFNWSSETFVDCIRWIDDRLTYPDD